MDIKEIVHKCDFTFHHYSIRLLHEDYHYIEYLIVECDDRRQLDKIRTSIQSVRQPGDYPQNIVVIPNLLTYCITQDSNICDLTNVFNNNMSISLFKEAFGSLHELYLQLFPTIIDNIKLTVRIGYSFRTPLIKNLGIVHRYYRTDLAMYKYFCLSFETAMTTHMICVYELYQCRDFLTSFTIKMGNHVELHISDMSAYSTVSNRYHLDVARLIISHTNLIHDLADYIVQYLPQRLKYNNWFPELADRCVYVIPINPKLIILPNMLISYTTKFPINQIAIEMLH